MDVRPSAQAMRELRHGLESAPSQRARRTEVHVYWGCVAVAAFLVGMVVGMEINPPRECMASLSDGRRLTSYLAGERKCVYEETNPKKWRPM